MSYGRDLSIERYTSDLVGASYPQPIDVAGVPDAFRGRWVLRVEADLPPCDALQDVAKVFELNVRRTVLEALELPKDIELTLPAVSAFRLDDHHLVLEIDTPGPQAQRGDEAAIATIGVLREADVRWRILDVQGIPKKFWFILNPSPE